MLSRRSFSVAACLAFGSIGVVRGASAAAQFSWKCATGPSGAFPLNVRLSEAFSGIRIETNGQLDIKLFPNSQLGGDNAMASQLRLGAIEMMGETGNIFDSIVPIASIDNVPFAYPNYDVPHRALDGSVGALVRNEFYAKGLFAFERVFDSGFREMFLSTKPVHTVGDLEGIKVRIPNSKIYTEAFRGLGASPTPIAYGETYSALQTRVVDAVEGPLSGMEDAKFYEVEKYCSLTNHMWACFWALVNREKWDGLPRTYQNVMRKHVNAAALAARRDVFALEGAAREKVVSQGLTVNDVNGATFKAKLKASGFYGRQREEWGAAVWTELEKYTGPLS